MEKNTRLSEPVFKVIILSPYKKGYVNVLENHNVSMMTTKCGINFGTLIIDDVSNKKIVLQIWDIHSDILNDKTMPYYLSGTQGAILVIDRSDPEAMIATQMKINELNKYNGKIVIGLVSENRSQQKDIVSIEDIDQYCFDSGTKIISHLNNKNDCLKPVFERIAYTLRTKTILID
ncbi:MAG: hypothetical protein ACTSP4_06745 [Candidatus Hodarchaeales archaeon]